MSFNEDVIQQVWEKGKVVSQNDPNIWRKDSCGAWMKKNAYGLPPVSWAYRKV